MLRSPLGSARLERESDRAIPSDGRGVSRSVASGAAQRRSAAAVGGEGIVKAKSGAVEKPIRLFAKQAQWAAWMEKNHQKPEGLWLRLAKKGSGLRSVTYAEALEIALCYGWIDGQKRGEREYGWRQRVRRR